MHIERVRFQNYRLLRDATLPLEPLTLLVGANGSGKSTVFEALQAVAANRADLFAQARTLGVPWTDGSNAEVFVVDTVKSFRVYDLTASSIAASSLPEPEARQGLAATRGPRRGGIGSVQATTEN